MKKRSNFTPMERFHEILIGHGLDATNVGINHIRQKPQKTCVT